MERGHKIGHSDFDPFEVQLKVLESGRAVVSWCVGDRDAGTAFGFTEDLAKRLTNAFSKKVENHIAALSLYFMFYNFCRVHQTLRVTPAMEAGISDHVWEIEEIVALLGR